MCFSLDWAQIIIMKHLFSWVIMLGLLLFFMWVAMAWYFGERTEKEFISVLENNLQEPGEKLFRAELLSYRKTLLGANAKLRISSDISVVSERMGEFQLQADLLNGPIFLSKSGIDIGSARWLLSFDKKSIDAEQSENLHSFFPEQLPTASVRVDFDKKAHYVGNIQSNMFDAIATGFFDLRSLSNLGSIKVSNFSYGDFANRVHAKALQISYQHQKSLSSNYKPGTTSIQIPELILTLKQLPEDLSFAAKVNSNISFRNNELSGFIKANLVGSNASSKIVNNPVTKAQVTLLFKGISSEGFIRLSEAKAELDNLQQQAQWLLEEQGEFPEGRDQIWQLQESIDSATKSLPATLKESVFIPGKSQIHFEARTSNNSGESTLSGEITPAELTISSSRLISFFQSQAMVKLDDHLFKFLSAVTPIKKQQFTLYYKQNKLLMQ